MAPQTLQPTSSRRRLRRAGRLERQVVGELGPAVLLPADVDDVVLAVGPDAPRAEEPPPRAEPPLLDERPREHERAAAHLVVVRRALRDPVDVDLERAPDPGRELH